MPFSRSVLITGGTIGLGFEAALEIARLHPEYLIVIASRTDKNSAAESINKILGQKNVLYLPLDLSNLAEVRTFASNWGSRGFAPIQALLLNAALQFPGGVVKTDDGIEATFAITHVGNALLFHLILPYLADSARVVITSSGIHDKAQKPGMHALYNTAEELAHPTPETEKYPGMQRYASSKLANVLWTYALDRKIQSLSRKNMTVVAICPGLMPGTGLAREAGAFLRFLWLHVMPRTMPLLRLLVMSNIHTPRESGISLAWHAVGLDAAGRSGKYFEGRKEIKSSKESYDEKKQDDLWEWTVKTISRSEEERKRFDTLHW